MRIIFFLSIIFFHSTSFATNYYVSSSEGDYDNNGKSPKRPKKTIQEAANLTRPGDTVFVMAGVYSNDCPTCNVVDIPNSGTAKRYIVYKNYPGQRPIIKFDGWAGISVRDGVSYIKIIGFEVIGNNSKITLRKALNQPRSCKNKGGEFDPKFNGNGIAIDGRSGKHPHHIYVGFNVVHDCGGGGIGASQADYIHIVGNKVYNNSWYNVFGASGISFYQFWNFDKAPGYHNVISRNKCFNNRSYVPWFNLCKITDGNGIIIDDFRNEQNGSKLGSYKSKTLIENNICWYNGGTGIHTFKADNVDIVNNTAYCNLQSPDLNAGQIIAGLSSNIRIANNIMVSNGEKIINSSWKNGLLVYLNNLHFNVSSSSNMKVYVNNSTCVNDRDPLFKNPRKSINADFTLQPASPAINSGNSVLFSNRDSNNLKRPRGNTSDIGAYEF